MKKIYAFDPTKKDNKGEQLSEDQTRAWQWVADFFTRIKKKKPEELTDHELEVQKMYTNTIIF